MQAMTNVPEPYNEPVNSYAPGSPERERLTAQLAEQANQQIDLTMSIGGRSVFGDGKRLEVVQPHRYASVLGNYGLASAEQVRSAADAAMASAPLWAAMDYDERAAIFLRAADLLAGPWREKIAAATMLGQSKSAQQAEIDAPCELIDFWRFNVAYGRRLISEQPISSPGVWNRLDHRPLEGFVYAITPFNFTAIAGNLPTAPALMGNTVVWKPAQTQLLAAYWTMELLKAAGLPPGVINLVTGDGATVSDVLLSDPRLAGIHFTGSTGVFQNLWKRVGNNVAKYHGYPRIVGETGGKDFVLAHASADPQVLTTALVRGAFEYQGQKCSAASRAFIPRSVWKTIRNDFLETVDGLAYGDVSNLSNFGGALIDERSFTKNTAAIDRARVTPGLEIAAGGGYDGSEGWFVRPTVVIGENPTDEIFSTEYFGPILAVHIYEDAQWPTIIDTIDGGSAYGLTGAIIATERNAINQARDGLRFAAGNFYVNDKPTGAVVGQQPFGGARASGTNDKAGSILNLLRWTSPRSLKETLVPATEHRYPHMD
ncbi:L-glutamate gamma-semialdehyde dehydrogenase [Paenarthrobacter sp. NPDC056912]|uniref:L-glutamate gamma-semialdehyde dehydrogenase n=1 Tax=Paenarthrobacter sp. NPDC056912 TaxID=3345965 RepID=UPI00366AD53C